MESSQLAGNTPGAPERPGRARLGVVVSDLDGRVRTASREVNEMLGADASSEGPMLSERFAGTGQFADWIGGALERAASNEAVEGLLRVERGGMVRAILTPLGDGTVALTVAPVDAGERVVTPQDVARKTWHDIQNQLGGLKLYATFLKRKLGSADDQVRETVDKIVAGIDAVAQSIADARRGEGGK